MNSQNLNPSYIPKKTQQIANATAFPLDRPNLPTKMNPNYLFARPESGSFQTEPGSSDNLASLLNSHNRSSEFLMSLLSERDSYFLNAR